MGDMMRIFSQVDTLWKEIAELAIELSVLLRYTDSDHPFGIFKLFLRTDPQHTCNDRTTPAKVT